MKHLIIKTITVLMLFGVLAPAGADHRNNVILSVMSLNLYVGADLGRLLPPVSDPPAAILATIQQTNFPERAMEIARAIDDFNPDLIGLQEVSLITLFDANGQIQFQLDYLAILLDALAARGESYTVASVVNNADVKLPIDPAAGTFGQLQDSDVILERNKTTTTSNPTSANFKDNFTVEFSGVSLEFTRGFNAVDAQVRGKPPIRVVNTHLEVEGAPCITKEGLQICQDLQAAELMAAIADEDLPVVLLGDFNARPGTIAYQTITGAGYTDTWTIRFPFPKEPGFTCCQAEGLTNELNQLSERIDHIFVRESGVQKTNAAATVVGDSKKRKTPGGLWYSDHGNPWALLWLKLVP